MTGDERVQAGLVSASASDPDLPTVPLGDRWATAPWPASMRRVPTYPPEGFAGDEPMPSEVGYGGGIPPAPFTGDRPHPDTLPTVARSSYSAGLTAAREQRDRDATLRSIVRDLAVTRPLYDNDHGSEVCLFCGSAPWPSAVIGMDPLGHEPDCLWRRAREATT